MYLISLLAIAITPYGVNGQQEGLASDTTYAQHDNLRDTNHVDHEINIGYLRSSFDRGETIIQDCNLGWTANIYNWSITNNISLLQGANQKSYNLSHSVLYKKEKYGIGLTVRHSNNPFAPRNSIQLGTYNWLSEHFILNAQITRIDFAEALHLLPLKISGTYANNGVGLSLGLTQDLSRLGSINPLINLSITYENKKSEVYSIYCSAGSVSQPQFRFQLVETDSSQLSYGAWLRKNLSPSITIIGGWGMTLIKNDQSSMRSTQINLSLSYKL